MRRSYLTAVRVAILAVCMAGLALMSDDTAGQEPKARPFADPEGAFKVGDTNKDGKLSREEFEKLLSGGPRFKENPEGRRLPVQPPRREQGRLPVPRRVQEAPRPAAQEDFPGKKNFPRKEDPKPTVTEKPTADQLAFFEKKIRPVLAGQCYQCHSEEAKKVKGNLLLDTRDGIRKGGDTGPAVVPGDPKKSLLAQGASSRRDELKMPPKKKLSDDVVADFEKWIAIGRRRPAGRQEGDGREGDRHREGPAVLGVPAAEEASPAGRPERRLAADATSTASCWPGWKRRG